LVLRRSEVVRRNLDPLVLAVALSLFRLGKASLD
jgi:hypothetical protein